MGSGRLPARARTGPVVSIGIVALVLLGGVAAGGSAGSSGGRPLQSSIVSASSAGPSPLNCVPPAPLSVTGAGSTFVFPLEYEWSSADTASSIVYSAVGDGTGVVDLSDKTTTFAMSEAPLSTAQRTVLPTALEIPDSAGPVAIVYNLAGVASLDLNGSVLAQIYLGTITMWNDPALVALNPGVSLPADPIVVAHRSDAAGTSYVLTQYLSMESSTWAGEVGYSESPIWPTGTGERADGGITTYVQTTTGSIGYTGLVYALQNGISFAALENPDGHFVVPTVAESASAITDLDPSAPPNDNWSAVNLLNAPGASDYPLVTFSYVIVYPDPGSAFGGSYTLADAENLINVLNWTIHEGQAYSEALYYVPLPAALVTSDLASLRSMTYNGSPIPMCGPSVAPPTNGLTQSVTGFVPTWTNLTPNLTALPNPRYRGGMAYDPAVNATFLFGGYSDSLGLLNDTWELQGTNWSKVATAVAPTIRYIDDAMAYDPTEQGIVLFGGVGAGSGGNSNNDTWLFNGSAWQNLSLPYAPPPGTPGPLTWDPLLDGMLYLAPTDPAETWLFDGTWTELAVGSEPTNVSLSAMTYDASDGYVLEFGGWNSSTATWVNSTYEFNNVTWTKITANVGPSGRLNSQMVFDGATNTVVLFGGLSANPGYQVIYNDTWTFHAGAWTLLRPAVAPPGIWLGMSTYDTSDHQMLLVDGQNVMGHTDSMEWTLAVTPVTLTASTSSTSGGTPLPVWLNSSVDGGVPLDNVQWTLNGSAEPAGADVSLILRAPGTYTANVSLTDPRGIFLNLSFSIVVYLVAYPVAFLGQGLPGGVPWSVTLNGTPQAASGDQVLFSEPNGTYRYVVGAVPGYSASPRNGSLTVAGSEASVTIRWGVTTYTVTFSETALPAGSSWSVSVNGTVGTSTTPAIAFMEPNGTFPYTVDAVTGYNATPTSGNVSVDGGPAMETILFTVNASGNPPPTSWNVTFSETGLPSGTLWSVTFDGVPQAASGSLVFSGNPNGTYVYSVGPVVGFTPTPTQGTVTVSGAAVSESVVFNATAPSSGGGGTKVLGLPSTDGYLVLAALAAIVVVVALLAVAMRRRPPPRMPPRAERTSGPSEPPAELLVAEPEAPLGEPAIEGDAPS